MSIQNTRTIEGACKDFLQDNMSNSNNIFVYQWIIDNKVILLYRKDNNLSYRYIGDNKDIVGPINFGEDNHSVEERIALLAKCLPKLGKNNVVYFTNPEICYTWEKIEMTILVHFGYCAPHSHTLALEKKCNLSTKLSLVWRPNECLWRIHELNKTFCSAFKTVATIPSIYCSKIGRSYSIIENLKQLEKQNIISLLKNFIIPKKIEINLFLKESQFFDVVKEEASLMGIGTRIKLCFSSLISAGRLYLGMCEDVMDVNTSLPQTIKMVDVLPGPFSVYLEPKSARSRIDERVRISQYQWGVTLIAFRGKSDNHAQLIIEGLDDDLNYFMKLIHFTGYEEVYNIPIKSEDWTGKRIEYKERTEIWKRPSDKVKEMMHHMEGQIPPFSRLGRDSLFNDSEDNCFTWLREELKIINVDLGKSLIGSVITLTRTYTQSDEEHLKNPVNDGEIV